MRYRPSRLPPEARGVVEAFRLGLAEALGRNLVGAYLIGSIAFGVRERHAGDVDFQVILRRDLNPKERSALGTLHASLVREYPLGEELDGYYLPVSKARRSRRPTGLAYWAEGRMRRGGSDETWALHRAHIRQGAYVVLAGPDPRGIYPPASWPEIAKELDHELAFTARALSRYPVYGTLNLCRLAYSWTERNPVVSKEAAGTWALSRFPRRWRRFIAAAIRSYRGRGTPSDARLVKRHVADFYAFALDWIGVAKGTMNG